MEFEQLALDRETNGKQKSEVIDTVIIPCDDVILAIGQDNAFPWIERDIGIDFDENDMPVVDKTTMQCTQPGVFFGGDAAWGPAEHHLGGGARAPGGDLDPQALPGRADHRAAGVRDESRQHQDRDARVELQQRLQSRAAREDDSTRSW